MPVVLLALVALARARRRSSADRRGSWSGRPRAAGRGRPRPPAWDRRRRSRVSAGWRRGAGPGPRARARSRRAAARATRWSAGSASAVGRWSRVPASAGPHGVAEAHLRPTVVTWSAPSARAQQPRRLVRGPGVDGDDPVRAAGLRGQGGQRPRQPRGAVVGDQDCGDASPSSERMLPASRPSSASAVGRRSPSTERRRRVRSQRHAGSHEAGVRWAGARSDRALLQLAALALAQAAPDAEPLVVRQGVLEALAAHVAADADLLGLAGGAALLREERLRVGLGAQGALLPAELALVVLGLVADDPRRQ